MENFKLKTTNRVNRLKLMFENATSFRIEN